MKIAVVNNWVPFLRGGAEHLADALTQKLREFGHEAILVRIPFRWEPPSKILESMLACRLMRLPNVERVVALKFPAFYIPHDDKLLWLLHQFRQAYDLWGTEFASLPDTPDGRQIRDCIFQSDTFYLNQARRIYTNSAVTSGRLKIFNGIESEVLLPPLLETGHLVCRQYGDYIFYPGRRVAAKRQWLIAESMRYVRTAVRLVIAGRAEDPAEFDKIAGIIRTYNLADRVHLIDRFISEAEKAELFGSCLACTYAPYDEDSYGYVTLESYYASKPVITCSDSGGITSLVKEGVTGLVLEPNPKAIAAALDQLFLDRKLAARLGEAGKQLAVSLNISWDNVIRHLTA
jgi:glycosyltransferase involved in cell wall biosynthesis